MVPDAAATLTSDAPLRSHPVCAASAGHALQDQRVLPAPGPDLPGLLGVGRGLWDCPCGLRLDQVSV